MGHFYSKNSGVMAPNSGPEQVLKRDTMQRNKEWNVTEGRGTKGKGQGKQYHLVGEIKFEKF